MTQLCDRQIRDLALKERLLVPFRPDNLNPASINITLSDEFSTISPTEGVIDLTDVDSFKYSKVKTREFLLPPKGFVLAVTEETVNIPDDVSAQVVGRSSWARGGLDNSSQAGFLDPGFSGKIVLEIKNLTEFHQKLTAGTCCAQLVFTQIEAPDVTYGEKKTSRYQNQTGVQGSLGVGGADS